MASGPITSWQIYGEIMETVKTLFWGAQNHRDGDCSHEIKRRLLLRRKVMTNLDGILKSKDCGTYTLWNITQPLKRIQLNQF